MSDLGVVGWVVVLVGVVFSIAWHELGHLLPAKLFGVKCTQYMIGFGPTLWSRRVGETQYGIKAIPFGGYVRMIGMFPPAREHARRGRFAEMIEQAREEARREVGPDDEDRQFYQRSVPKRLIIMIGGPAMNLLLALVLFAVTFTSIGVARETVVDTVSQCMTKAGEKRTTCRPNDEISPAAKAGILPGDRLLAIDGVRSDNWTDLFDAIRAAGGRNVPIVVLRDGHEVTLQALIKANEVYKVDAKGNAVTKPDGTVETVTAGFLGVTRRTAMVPVPVSGVPGALVDTISPVFSSLAHVPAKFAGVVTTLIEGEKRDPESPMSLVGVGRIGGEIGSMDLPAKSKLAVWLMLLGSLNLALFLFNLLPLLPLDGGHAAGATWEGLRRFVARLRRRPDPGPVDVARALPVAYGVAAFLLGASLLLVYADIVAPVRLNS